MWVHRASRTHACMHRVVPRPSASGHAARACCTSYHSLPRARAQQPRSPPIPAACAPCMRPRDGRAAPIDRSICSCVFRGVDRCRAAAARRTSARAARTPDDGPAGTARARMHIVARTRSTCMVVADPIHGRMIERIDAAGAGRRDRLTGRIRGLDLDTEARSPHRGRTCRARACRLALSTAVMTIKLLLHVLLRHTILSIYVLRSALYL